MTSTYTHSFWEMDTLLAPADLCIIGAGIVGLSTALAYRALSPESRIVVLERGMMPQGASTRNAGFACFGSLSELADDYSRSDEHEVNETIKMRWEGLQLLRKNVGDHNMDYQSNGGVEVFRNKSDFDRYATYASEFNEKLFHIIGLKDIYTIEKASPSSLGMIGFVGMIKNKYEGLLHPGKMMQTLILKCRQQQIDIFFGARVDQITEDNDWSQIKLEGGQLMSRKVLVATNGFAKELLPATDVVPARNLVLLTSEIDHLQIPTGFHLDSGYVYFRPVGKRLLLGGSRNLDEMTETTEKFGENPIIKEHLEFLLREQILPHKKFNIEHSWSGIMGVGKVKKPIIKMISERIGVAVRMGGMGVAIGSYVGKQAAEMIRFDR